MRIFSVLKIKFVSEARAFNELLVRIYKQFGFHDVSVKLSLRPEKRAGSDDGMGIRQNKVARSIDCLRCGMGRIAG